MSTKNEKTEVRADATRAAVYSKEQIIQSDRFGARKDAIQAILVHGKTYTIAEVDRLLENFMKGKVR